ncbi:Ndufa5, NADH-ubiquinone oxidoreductase subunit [Gautieria morchelliformis]|nr:Ndufa5, NADH-ubiquinone oxidoreductase subunit [Gautieria morchelliformis]
MFRATRPLFTALKASTGLTGLAVHPNPLPALRQTLESTLETLSTIPVHSVYRQATTTITQRKLGILDRADGNLSAVEKEIDQGQIEEVLKAAEDELSLARKMIEWKAWESLAEEPVPGQFDYFGKTTSPS